MRIGTIDRIKGLGVLLMIPLNLWGYFLMQGVKPPFWLSFVGSQAAPIFIISSSMLVALNSTKGKNLPHFLQRGFSLLVAGVLVDILIWNIWPGTEFDILYFFALSLPITHLSLGLSSRGRLFLLAAILLAAPSLRLFFGYTDIVSYLPLFSTQALPHIQRPSPIWHHWIIDGIFPLIPWISLSLTGTIIGQSIRLSVGELRSNPDPGTSPDGAPALMGGSPSTTGFKRSSPTLKRYGQSLVRQIRAGIENKGLFYGGLLVILGFALERFLPEERHWRRFSEPELFYPATTGFMIYSTGLFLAVFDLLSRIKNISNRPLLFLEDLGRHSLAIYMTRLALGRILIIALQAQRPDPPLFWILALVVLMTSWAFAKLFDLFKNKKLSHA